MKKFLATILCLGIMSTPCFAYGRYDYNRPSSDRIESPRMEKIFQPAPPPERAHYYKHHRSNKVATTIAVTAGVIGVAALISALAD